jgi:hypothetical protein
MDTLLLSVGNHFGGVRLIVKPSKRRSSKKEKAWNTIAAKYVEWLLNEPKNKSIILNQLCESALFGTGIGMSTGKDVSLQPISYKSFVKSATKRKPAQKTR